MAYNIGSFAVGATGNTSIVISGTPTWVRFTTGAKGTAETTDSRHGVGFWDGTNQFATATLVNAHGYYSRNYGSSAIVVLGTPGSNITELVQGTVVSVTANSLNLNFSKADSNYTIYVEYGT